MDYLELSICYDGRFEVKLHRVCCPLACLIGALVSRETQHKLLQWSVNQEYEAFA